ncbi:DUF3313 family protein [Sulfurimonas sp.]
MKIQIILTATISSMVLLFSGCASKSVAVTNSGFFEDYKKFAKINKATTDISSYKNIMLSPVEVISYIPLAQQTPEQKNLYKEISTYLNAEYKLIVEKNSKYSLAQAKAPNTLILESAVSTVEVHEDDENWNPHAPVDMGLSVVSFNAYINEDVRLLGEKRLVDSQSGKVVTNSMDIQNTIKIVPDGDALTFKDIKPALDSWLEKVKKDLE